MKKIIIIFFVGCLALLVIASGLDAIGIIDLEKMAAKAEEKRAEEERMAQEERETKKSK